MQNINKAMLRWCSLFSLFGIVVPVL